MMLKYRFQSLVGRLETVVLLPHQLYLRSWFQSLVGRLETGWEEVTSFNEMQFQSLVGRLETEEWCRPPTSTICFNPS
ncbi:MAG: hypothetical protein PWP58_549 [Bacillota bacterium]|nr:hypothetical protein [Bacillota bacterium]